nr:hypothetical protein [Nonomuraea typhae]
MSGLGGVGRRGFGAGVVVGQERVELGGFGGGVAEAPADRFDGDTDVDEFGGVGAPERVDVDLDFGRPEGEDSRPDRRRNAFE